MRVGGVKAAATAGVWAGCAGCAAAGCTTTRVLAPETFPEASRAMKRTVVVPSGKNDGALFAIVGAGSTMSAARTPARSSAIAA
jgi:hypothetical protein